LEGFNNDSAMIPYFPKPYLRESFHSILCRCASRMLLSLPRLCHVLFNGKRIYPITGLANFVHDFVASTKHVISIDEHELIERHTIANYLQHFYSKNQWALIMRKMIEGDNKLLSIMGVVGSGTNQKIPRYCPLCNQESLQQNGELYWKTIHQIPNVNICAVHKCFLEPAEIEVIHRGSHQFVCATEKTCPTTKHTDCHNKNLINIAEKMLELFNANRKINYHNRDYRKEAMHAGFVKGNRFDWKRFCREFNSFYAGEEKYYSGEIKGKLLPRSFIYSSSKNFRPITHLLVEVFLEHCKVLKEKSISPFGNGPWRCLNKICKDYDRPVIATCTWYVNENHRVVGRFLCRCGMEYLLSYATNNRGDIHKRIVEYGPKWFECVKQLLKRNLTDTEIGNIVGCHNWKRHYYRKKFKRPKNLKKSVTEIGAKRGEWESALRKFPKLTITAIRPKFSRIYNYLLRYDSAWFIRFNKQFLGRRMKRKEINYFEKDSAMVAKLKTNFKILVANDFPYRITRNLLLNSINQREKNVKRFTLTHQFLTKHAETQKAFKNRVRLK